MAPFDLSFLDYVVILIKYNLITTIDFIEQILGVIFHVTRRGTVQDEIKVLIYSGYEDYLIWWTDLTSIHKELRSAKYELYVSTVIIEVLLRDQNEIRPQW